MTEEPDTAANPVEPPPVPEAVAAPRRDDDSPAREEDGFIPLDPRVVNLWRISHFIGSVFLLGFAAFPALIVALSVRGSWPLLLGAWCALLLIRMALLIWHPPRRYENWGYRLTEKTLETRQGVWWKVDQLLPLSRLQHVDLQKGPIERSLGLASVVIHTAGTQQAAIVIPGLDTEAAQALRDELAAIGGDDGV